MGTLNLYSRWMRMNQSSNPLNANDVADLVDTNSGLSQISAVKDVTNTGAGKIAGGLGTLVTGTLTIATGLTAITSFQTTLNSQPNATGAASNQILTAVATTGSVLVTAYSVSSATGATIAANTSTGTFFWLAYGT